MKEIHFSMEEEIQIVKIGNINWSEVSTIPTSEAEGCAKTCLLT